MGALLVAALIPGPLKLGDVSLDSATLLFAVAAMLVGTQMVLFYALAQCYAVAAGLIPASRRFERMQEALTVDRFCALGGGLFAVGVLIAAIAVVRWGAAGFGDLDPEANIRFAALSTLAMALGIQSATTGFLLGLTRHRRRARDDASGGSAQPHEESSTPPLEERRAVAEDEVRQRRAG
jgi:hypothetical protein